MFTQFNANLIEYFGYHLSLVEHTRQDFFRVFAYFYHVQFNILMSTFRPYPDIGKRKAVQIYMLLGVNNNYKK